MLLGCLTGTVLSTASSEAREANAKRGAESRGLDEFGLEAAGHEWSASWSGTSALWHGALLLRLHYWLPTGTLLEIGRAFGRWTQYLKELAKFIILVDVAEEFIK